MSSRGKLYCSIGPSTSQTSKRSLYETARFVPYDCSQLRQDCQEVEVIKNNGINKKTCQKFAVAAGVLFTRVFSKVPEANPRRLAIGCGPITNRRISPNPDSKFDVLGLGFRPGREWKGPVQVFIEEMRTDRSVVWENCRFWTSIVDGPLYVLTEDKDVCFSYDGYSLVPLGGRVPDPEEGAQRAIARLCEAARRIGDNYERQTMM